MNEDDESIAKELDGRDAVDAAIKYFEELESDQNWRFRKFTAWSGGKFGRDGMSEIMNLATVLAYFLVFLIGLYHCFNEARHAWITRNSTGLTVFERRSYALKAGSSCSLGMLALIGLFDAARGVF